MTEDFGQFNDARGFDRNGSDSDSFSGGQDAATLIGQTAISIERPAPGQNLSIDAEAGQRYVIEFSPDAANVRVQGNNLILDFPDGASITFQNLGAVADQPDAPVFEVAGQPISSTVIFGQAVALAGGADAPTFETAAAPSTLQGTGETRYDDDTGELIDLIDPQGVIPGTELEFGLIDLEPTDVIADEVAEEPTTPPVDFDVDVTANRIESLADAGLTFADGVGFGGGGGGGTTIGLSGTTFVMDNRFDGGEGGGGAQILRIEQDGSFSVAVTHAEIEAATGDDFVDFDNAGLAIDLAGNIYFTEGETESVYVKPADGGPVRLVASEADIESALDAAGIVESSADTVGLALAPDGFLYLGEENSNSILRIDPATGATTVVVTESDFEALPGVTSAEIDGGGLIVSADGTKLYVASDGNPEAIFTVDLATDTVSVLSDDVRFADLDVYMVLAPNGDIIVSDDAGGDTIFRVTPDGVVTEFLTAAQIQAAASSDIDLEGGIWFDADGNFYIAEQETSTIYRWDAVDPAAGTIDPDSGAVFIAAGTFQAALGFEPDFEGDAEVAPVAIAAPSGGGEPTSPGTPLNLASPTGLQLPDAVTAVGGVVLDMVGLNGTRVVTQLPASELFVGFFDGGTPAEFRGDPGTIGIQEGFTPEILNLLGGGLSQVAIRITVFDGDTALGNFDENDNLLLLNGVNFGDWTDVTTITTDGAGVETGAAHAGFDNNKLDTGWFFSNDPATLVSFFGTLVGSNSVAFKLDDTDPFDNFFDFTQGIDGGLVDIGTGPLISGGQQDQGGFLYEFQVGEAEIVADNIHGTDVEDGVTTFFTITSLPTDANGNPTGFLLIDRGDDNVIEEIIGTGFGSVPVTVQTGDSVFYYLPASASESFPGPVTFNYFTTDSDGLNSLGDGPATITIGFPDAVNENDTPLAGNVSMVHDETPGIDNPNDVSLASFSTGLAAALSAVFAGAVPAALGAAQSSVAFDFGQNGAGATGSIGLSGLSSGGLIDTQTGLAVDVVSGPNGTLVGHAGVGGEIVFVAFLEQVGPLTGPDNAGSADTWFVQYRAVEHNDPADADEAASPESIVLSYDVTDADGDTASGTIAVAVEDDGPSIADISMINDETPGIDHADDVDLAAVTLPAEILALGLTPINASAKTITFDYGADGPGGIALDTVVDGTDSGLVDTQTGLSILLFNGPDGTVLGRVGDANGPVAFVSVMGDPAAPSGVDNISSAELSFVQYRAIEHDNPLDHDEANPEPGGPPAAASHVIDFEAGFVAGDIVSTIATPFGTVAVTGINPTFVGTNAAMIFDSNNPTGGDFDLGSPNNGFPGGVGVDTDGNPNTGGNPGSPFENNVSLGNILIVSEDLDSSDPDDTSVVGTTLAFDFSDIGSVMVESITIIDVDQGEIPAHVSLFDDAGVLVASFLLPRVGDNGVANVSLGDTRGVVRVEVVLNGSGAIDNLTFRPDAQGFEDEFLTLGYTVTDGDGDTAAATATIFIEDDGPIANDDGPVFIDGAEGGSTSGNVLANDDLGADGAVVAGEPLTLFTFNGDDGLGNEIEFTAAAGTTVTTFAGGSLTVNADGTWDYAPGLGDGLSTAGYIDDFTYVIEDGDGDTARATQEIRVVLDPAAVQTALPGGSTLTGDAGDDFLRGGDGVDILNAQGGNDLLFGGGGDDTLVAGTGNDQLFGDGGADTFSFSLAANEGTNTIGDFSGLGGEGDVLSFGDVVDVAGTTAGIDIDDVVSSFSKTGSTVTVDLHSGTTLIIEDVSNVLNSITDLDDNSLINGV